ncbi:MAG: ATP-binding protein [Terriglobales bacterium]
MTSSGERRSPVPAAWRTHSLRGRLMAAVLLSQLLLAWGLAWAGMSLTRRALNAAFEATLRGRAMSIAALVHYREDSQSGLQFETALVPPAADPPYSDFYEVRTAQGELVARSPGWEGLQPPAAGATQEPWTLSHDGTPYRGLVLANLPVLDPEEVPPGHALRLQVSYAAPTVRMQAAVAELWRDWSLVSLLLLLITGGLAFWGVRRGLWPLRDLTRAATAISTRHWEFHPPPPARAVRELQPLIAAIEAMLAGLERAFTQQQDFLGNAAHELKTPVAVLKSSMQGLLRQPRPPEEYRSGLEASLTDIARLENLLQRMLRLARMERQGVAGSRSLLPIELAATCEAAAARVRALAAAKQVVLELATAPRLCMVADGDDLELVWVNLLENAIQHSPPEACVQFALHADGTNAVVTVRDHGAGITDEDMPHLFERFYRGDPSRARATGGFGLGLAIAKAVVEAYGGTITAASPAEGGAGLTVTLPLGEEVGGGHLIRG